METEQKKNPNPLVLTEKEIVNEGSVGVLYLNSAKNLNALSNEMRNEICSVLTEFKNDPKIKVVVILSKVPKAFCAGANIKEFENVTIEQLYSNYPFQEFCDLLNNFTKPLISGVNGFALGGGCEISLASDIVLCSKEAQFGLPELDLGLIPGFGGTVRMTKALGKVRASYYMYTSERISAESAKSMGMVIEVCENLEALHQRCIEIAKKIAMKAQITLMLCKQSIIGAEDNGNHEALKNEQKLFKTCFNTKAKTEGTTAFVEKRKPDFKDL